MLGQHRGLWWVLPPEAGRANYKRPRLHPSPLSTPHSTAQAVPLFNVPHTSTAITDKIEPTPKPNQKYRHHHSKRRQTMHAHIEQCTVPGNAYTKLIAQACNQLHCALCCGSIVIFCSELLQSTTLHFNLLGLLFSSVWNLFVHCCIETITMDHIAVHWDACQ